MAGLNCLPRFRNPFARKKKASQKGEDFQKTRREEPVPQTTQRTPLTPPRIQSDDNNDEPLLAPIISVRTATEPVQPHTDETQRPSRSPSTATLKAPPRHSRRSSEVEPRTRSSSNASSTDGHWLKEQLHGERIECPHWPHTFFVPRCRQENLIIAETIVKDIQDRNSDIGESHAVQYADAICNRAVKLYCTLAYIKKGGSICPMLDEGLTDKDLPLERKPNEKSKFTLMRQNGQPIKTMEGWKDKHLENFDRVQHWMTAPVFQNLVYHDLDKKTILPFVPLDNSNEKLKKKEGGYSEVYPVRIHPAHHEFWEKSSTVEEEPLVAVKALFSSEEDEFLKEVTILKALGPKNHPHLIKLLATYRQNGRYHLLFPYANSNLRTYWEERPLPEFNKKNILWSMRQMTGIAHGLVHIHSFRQTVPLSVGAGNVRMPPGKGTIKLSIKGGEEWFGRHGDIKPENILWFDEDSKGENPMGLLQIADFGLGRFHGRDSRSNRNPDSIRFSPTYEPPECKLRQPVSRVYDMWSLGCLYLEFITWLLKGSEAIEEFSEARGQYNSETRIDDDNFFTIITNTNGTKGIVREAVNVWVRDLHAHKNCSPLIHNLLDLTMKEMVVIESKERSTASWLYQRLHMYLKKAEIDDDYLLKPEPRDYKPVSGRTNSTPAVLEIPASNPKRNSVTFLTEEKPAPPPPPPKPLKPVHIPKDLVLRKVGTPGSKSTKTWPTGDNGKHTQTPLVVTINKV